MISSIRSFQLRLKFACLDLGSDTNGTINQARLITLRLTTHVQLESLHLFGTNLVQIAIVNGGVKSDTRTVQLIRDCGIELLLRDQNFEVRAPERNGNGGVKQGLSEPASGKAKWLISFLSGPMSSLVA